MKTSTLYDAIYLFQERMGVDLWKKCEDSIKEYEGLGSCTNDWIYHFDKTAWDEHIILNTFSQEIVNMFDSKIIDFSA